MEFSHRDLNDGNVMMRVLREPVEGPDDVDVWLFDFGKSMALIDGERVSAGMWDPKTTTRIHSFNPTTDIVRLLTNITQSLIRSYTGEKGVAPVEGTREFLEQHMPFGAQTQRWLEYLRECKGEAHYEDLWVKKIEAKDARGGPTKNLSGRRDYLDFCAKPAFPIMIEYYNLPPCVPSPSPSRPGTRPYARPHPHSRVRATRDQV